MAPARDQARLGKRGTEAANEGFRGRRMATNHSGGHAGHMPGTGDRRALVISGWLTGIYFLVEPGIGLWTGSVAVMSAAFHTFPAVAGALIPLAAQRLGARGATPPQALASAPRPG